MPSGSAVLVDDRDPRDAARRLTAAVAAGAVPVLVGPGWPRSGHDRLLVAAGRLPRDQGRIVVLTSGSSATPRAVVRTWYSWQRSFAGFDQVTGLGPADLIWVPGTAASTLTLFGVLHALHRGLRLRTGGAWRGLPADPSQRPRLAAVTAVHAVPAVVAEVLTGAAEGRLPRLATVVTAGAAVPAALRGRARALGIRLVEYYGAAELSFVAVDPDGTGLRPFPGVEVEVRDGVVWARSPYLADGYLAVDCEPDGPLRRDGDGWACVGDRARLGPDGRLQIEGRPGSTASVGATTVLLDDVEAVLREVPGVVEVVCGGEPAGSLGERLVAVVQPVPGTDPRPGLRAAARAGLPPPARPARWLLDPRLPTTAAGKVDRILVRDRIRSMVDLRHPAAEPDRGTR